MMLAISRLPWMIWNRLLKSWAMPPARVMRLSAFWALRRVSSWSFRSRMSVMIPRVPVNSSWEPNSGSAETSTSTP